MKLHFVTKNRFKYSEVKRALEPFGIDVIQVADEKIEPKEFTIEEVAELNAKHFYDKLGVPVVVEDTGIFFDAYSSFPGNHPKLMFNLLGYKGLLKLLDGENRNAEFRSVVGYCDSGDVKLFKGILRGEISEEVHDEDADVMPYERIFLLDGKPISKLTREEKNKISHRSKAFNALGKTLI